MLCSCTDRWNSLLFLHVDTNSQKLKVYRKFFWLGIVKNGRGQYSIGTLKLTASQEWTDENNYFLHAGTNSCKLKGDWKFWGWHGQKWVWAIWWQGSKTECIWRMSRWNNWFFACWYRFTKIKCKSKFFSQSKVKSEYGQSGHGTLKCWYKFRKAKSWFNDFWMSMVKNGLGLLVHETLISAVLKNEYMNWADFLNADGDDDHHLF